jgi:hypothetical protein
MAGWPGMRDLAWLGRLGLVMPVRDSPNPGWVEPKLQVWPGSVRSCQTGSIYCMHKEFVVNVMLLVIGHSLVFRHNSWLCLFAHLVGELLSQPAPRNSWMDSWSGDRGIRGGGYMGCELIALPHTPIAPHGQERHRI